MKVFDLTETKKPEKWFRPTHVLTIDGTYKSCNFDKTDWLNDNTYSHWRNGIYSITKISSDLAFVCVTGNGEKGAVYKGDFKL